MLIVKPAVFRAEHPVRTDLIQLLESSHSEANLEEIWVSFERISILLFTCSSDGSDTHAVCCRGVQFVQVRQVPAPSRATGPFPIPVIPLQPLLLFLLYSFRLLVGIPTDTQGSLLSSPTSHTQYPHTYTNSSMTPALPQSPAPWT